VPQREAAGEKCILCPAEISVQADFISYHHGKISENLRRLSCEGGKILGYRDEADKGVFRTAYVLKSHVIVQSVFLWRNNADWPLRPEERGAPFGKDE
jgi:hypothetical protein